MKHHLLRLALALLFIIFFLIFTSASNDHEWKQERLQSRGEKQDKQTISKESERSQNPIESIENDGQDVVIANDEDILQQSLDELEETNESIDEGYNYELPPFDYNLLPHCPPDTEDKEQEIVVVSTLDGRITGIDVANGAVVWSHQTGGKRNAMLSSSMTNIEVTSNRGEWVRLIPSLDGGIYRFNGEDIEALPLTADTLLHSSFKFSTDTIFSGGKSSEVWGMDVASGRLIYMCNAGGCHREKETASSPGNILVVKRVTQSVRAVDPKSGDERWNFSVGQHEVNLADTGCSRSGTSTSDKEFSQKLRFIVPDGRISAIDMESHLVWEQKLPSALVNAWRVFDGEVEEVDLFSGSSVPALRPESQKLESEEQDIKKNPALYVGVHNEQLYIQQSGAMKSRVAATAQVFSHEHPNLAAFPRVQWKPYLATSLSRTPVMNIKRSSKHPLLGYVKKEDDSTALSLQQDIDYPYDHGYYLYGDEFSPAPNESLDIEVDEILEDESIIEDITSQVIHFCIHIGPETWLQVFFSLTLVVALHVLFIRYIVANMRRRLNVQALELVRQLLNNIIRNNPNIVRLIQRLGMQALPPPENPPPDPVQPVAAVAAPEELNVAEQTPIPLPPPEVLERTSSQNSESSSVIFTSRYATDFEPIQCLGRGGFGVVFEVRNKLDENEYAVKRITLPLKESSGERVKREVRALAKLNHNNIVRYYNSWLETPPSGWLEETDSWWKNADLNSSLLSPDMEDTELDESKMISEPSKVGPIRENSILNLAPQHIHNITKPEKNPLFQIQPFFSKKNQANNDSDNFNEWEESERSSFDHQDRNSLATFGDYSINDNSSSEDHSRVSRNIPYSANVDNSEDDSYIQFGNSENTRSVEDIENKISCRKRNSDSDSKSKFKSDECDESVDDFVVFKNSVSKNKKNDSENSIVDDIKNSRILGKALNTPEQRLSESEDKQRPKSLSLDVTNVFKEKKDSIQCRTYMYIQMELCKKESLRDWLMKNRNRDSHEVYSIFHDITRAVEYVHDNQLMHRDLKPSNIFFSLDGEVKIGDFGLVTAIAEDEDELRTPAGGEMFSNSLINAKHTRRVGTQLYMSPEQVSGLIYDYKVDIYSLGLIFFEMLVPFSTGMERLEVMTLVRNRSFPAGFEEKFPNELSLLEMMLSHNPVERPTTRGIRSRDPLSQLQGNDVRDIKPEDHFRLLRSRSHNRSNSGSSFSFITSASV